MNLPIRFLLASLMVTLAGCAITPSGGRADANLDGKIMERALTRWNLLIKGDASKAWEYLSPGYRATRPREKYVREVSQRSVRWTDVNPFRPDEESQVKAVECGSNGLSCDVRLRVGFKIRSHLTGVGLVESASVIKESWVKIKGQWYIVPMDVVR